MARSCSRLLCPAPGWTYDNAGNVTGNLDGTDYDV
jgi:phenylpropionate dioxygenase-like ring-hydroxylating dioxygenase large terminal subunit